MAAAEPRPAPEEGGPAGSGRA